MTVWRHVVLAWACCIATAQAGVRALPPDAVLVEPERLGAESVRSQTDATQTLAEIAQGRADLALARLESLNDPVRFELAAARVIEALQAQPASASGDAVLAALEHAPVRVFRRHEETAADWFVPLVDVAGRAMSARRLHAFVLERDALIAKLERAPVELTKTDSGQLVAAAIEGLSSDAVTRLAEAALRDDVALPSQAWAALARRAPRPELLEAALKQAAPVDVLPLFDVVLPALTPEVALPWLESAAQRSDYASIAVMSLGALASRSPAAEAALAKHLGRSDTGPSAAAALAQLAVTDRVQRIDALLAKSQSPLAVAHLALALRLEGSTAALQRLQRLERDPRLPDAAKAELQR